jgi:hypothetical protein
MIEQTKAYRVGERTFGTLREAQVAELQQVLHGTDEAVALEMVDNADVIVDILTTTGASRPKARAIHGGRKPRKAKEAAATPPTA